MSIFIVGLFLLLYGIVGLFHAEIPQWVLALTAFIAGILVIVEGWRPGLFKRGP